MEMLNLPALIDDDLIHFDELLLSEFNLIVSVKEDLSQMPYLFFVLGFVWFLYFFG